MSSSTIKSILILGKKNRNPFFDGITRHSKHVFEYGLIDSYSKKYDYILIHWPEQLIHKNQDFEEAYDNLKSQLQAIAPNTRILYVVHNLNPHKYRTRENQLLYELTYDYTHTFIHLGNYSKQKLEPKFRKKRHVVISHPLYEEPFQQISKNTARQRLNIPEDALVFVAPGRIRKIEERNLILRLFRNAKHSKKLLLVPNMFWKKSSIDFRGRTALKKWFDVKKHIENFINKPKYNERYSYGYTTFELLSLYISAADIVLIPRLNTLNSGNLFLGLTFKKIVIGASIGNISEYLNDFEFPTFKVDDKKSQELAIKKALHLAQNNYAISSNKLVKFLPKNVAYQWDKLLESKN